MDKEKNTWKRAEPRQWFEYQTFSENYLVTLKKEGDVMPPKNINCYEKILWKDEAGKEVVGWAVNVSKYLWEEIEKAVSSEVKEIIEGKDPEVEFIPLVEAPLKKE